ncbi:MAG TPA: glycosyltransferase [Ktedonobacteraceae bacterium]|nr:glycosyltransferase [Ktedonobacteraceae bacterium]
MLISEQGSHEIATAKRPISSKRFDERGAWTIPGSYAPGQAATHPLRILIVATEAPPVRGGIARIVGYLRDGLQGRGHHVDVLAYPEVGRLVFGEVRLSSLIFKLPQLFHRVNEYDIIHVHGVTPTFSDLFLLFVHLRNPRLPVIYTHHLDLDFTPAFLTGMYNRLHHWLSAHTSAVVAATDHTLALLHDKRGRGSVIPYGIDLAHFSTNRRKDEQFTVLFVGQFRPWKGVRILLQAMSQVKNARLLLVGQGPEEQAYRSLAKELDLDVQFYIGVNDDSLRQLYERAHVIVLPSISQLEAFGLALIEGMAAGCIPIASDLPGVREVVGRIGFLFPPGDANELATILRDLLNNPEQVQQTAEYARMYATQFSQDRTICEYERLFTCLVAARELKEQIEQITHKTQSYAPALQQFMSHVARDLEADWAGLVLQEAQDKFRFVAFTGSLSLLTRQQLERVSSQLAWSAMNTDDSIRLEPHDDNLHLDEVLVREMPAVIAVPLIIDGKRIGAMLSMRERSFDQYDLDSLKRFAFYAAPSLRAIIKLNDGIPGLAKELNDGIPGLAKDFASTTPS